MSRKTEKDNQDFALEEETNGKISVKRLLMPVIIGLIAIVALLIIISLMSGEAEASYGLSLEVTPDIEDTDTTTTPPRAVFSCIVTNEGTSEEDVNLTVSFIDPGKEAAGWTVTPKKKSVNKIGAGDDRDVTITVTVPESEPAGTVAELEAYAYVKQDPGMDAIDSFQVRVSQIYDVLLTVKNDDNAKTVNRGETVIYNLTLNNTGNGKDTFVFEAVGTPTGWGVSFSPFEKELARGATYPVTMRIEVPYETEGKMHTISVNAISQGPTGAQSSIVTFTTVNKYYELDIGVSPSKPQTGELGGVVDYTFTVNNLGNTVDYVTVSVNSLDGWQTSLGSTASKTIPYQGSKDWVLTVFIPEDVYVWEWGRVEFTATSNNDPSATNSLTAYTNVETVYGVDLDLTPPLLETDPETFITFDVQVTNVGNLNDTIKFTYESEDYVCILDPPRLSSLSPDTPMTVKLNVTIPGDALAGPHYVTVIATCGDETTSTSVIATIDVNPYYQIDLVPLDASKSGEPGGSPVSFKLRVRNQGTGEDTIYLEKTGQKEDWASLSAPQVTVAGRSYKDVYVNVTIPEDELINTWYINVTGRSSEDPTLIDNASFQIKVLQVYSVELSSTQSSRKILPGEEKSYEILIFNSGTGTDKFEITVWHEDIFTYTWTRTSNSTITLEGRDSKIEQLYVEVPYRTTSGFYNIWFNVTSNKVSDSFLTVTEVPDIHDVYIPTEEQSGEASPDTKIIYQVQVYNSGTKTDLFKVAKSGDQTSWAAVPTEYSLFYLQPGKFVIINVTVTLPNNALDKPELADGIHNCKIIVTSQNDTEPKAFAAVWLNTTVTPTRDGELTVTEDTFFAKAGDKVIFTVQIKNTGSAVDTLTIEDTGPYSTWGSFEVPPSFTLAPLESNTTHYIVTVDKDAKMEDSPFELYLIVKSLEGDDEIVDNITLTIELNQTFAVDLSSSPTTTWADPGDEVKFEVTIVNEGNDQDDFTLSWTASETLEVQGFEGTVRLDAEEEIVINVTVIVDDDHDTSDIWILLNATSKGDSNVHGLYQLTIHVNPRYGVKLSASGQNTKEVHGGDSVTFYLKIKNTGTAIDTFDIDPIGSQGYWATLEETVITLNPQETSIVEVIVEPPEGTDIGLIPIDISVTSQQDADVTETFTFYADVKQSYAVSLSATQYTRTVDAGDPATFTLTIRNDGNGQDTFVVDVTGLPSGWTVDTIPPITLQADSPTNENVVIHTTTTTKKGNYPFNITVRSQGDTNVFDEIGPIVIINQIYGVDIVPTTTPSGTGDIGETLTFLIEVKNEGNGEDKIQLKITGDHPEFATLFYNQTEQGGIIDVTPDPQRSVNVYLNITIPLKYWDDYTQDSFVITVEAKSEDEATSIVTQDFTITVNAVYGVLLNVQGASWRSGVPGEPVDFDIIIKNDGTAIDNFNLQVKEVISPSGEDNADPNIWFSNIQISPSSINGLPSGMTSDVVEVRIQPIPDDLEKVPIGIYRIVIEVESSNDPDVKDNITLEVDVDQVYAADIQNTVQTKPVDVGASVDYSIKIKNVGNYRDTFTVEILGDDPDIPGSEDWGLLYHAGTDQSGKVISDIWLNASESTTIKLTVTVPDDSLDDTVTLTIKVSPGDTEGTTEEVDVTTDMNTVYDFEFTYVSRKLTADPDSSVTFILKIKNTGTGDDTFTPAVDEWVHADWSTINPPNPEFVEDSLDLPPGESGQITMTVYTPAVDEGTIALAGFYNITIRVDSEDGEDVQTKTFIVDLQPMYVVTLALPGSDSKPVDVGENVTYQFTITNDGNEPDTFTFDVVDEDTSPITGYGDQSGWAMIALLSDPQNEISSIDLEPGESRTMILTISVPNLADPSFAKVLTLGITVIATSEQDNTVTDQFTTSTTINPIYSFTLTAVDATQEGFAGDTIRFTLKIKNKGTAQDTYNFDVTEYDSNIFTLTPNPPDTITGLPVDATDQSVFDVDITSDRDQAELGSYTIRIMAISENDASVTQNITLTIDITGPIYTPYLWSSKTTKDANAGDTITFTLKVDNQGTSTDSYDLLASVIDSDIFITHTFTPSAITNVEEDGTGQCNFEIEITDDRDFAVPGQSYDIVVRATSQNDATSFSELSLTINIEGPIYDCYLDTEKRTETANAGDTVTFTLKVDNDGTHTDSFDLSVVNLPAAISSYTFSPTSINNVAKDSTGQCDFIIDITDDRDKAEPGQTYDIIVKATSQNDVNVFSNLTLKIEIEGPIYECYLWTSKTSKDADAGQSVTFTLNIDNKGEGDATDSYDLIAKTIDSDVFTSYTFTPASVTNIEVDGTGQFDFQVEITDDRDDAKPGQSYDIVLNVTSQSDPKVFFEIKLTINIEGPLYDFTLDSTSPQDKQKGKPGEDVVFTLRVTNNKDQDSYKFEAGDKDDVIFTDVVFDSLELSNIAKDASGTNKVTISIFDDELEALAGTYPIEVIATSVTDPTVTESLTLYVEITSVGKVTVEILAPTSQEGEPGEELEYTVKIKNMGNDNDTFEMSLTGTADDWSVLKDNEGKTVTSLALESEDFAYLTLTVTIPAGGETEAGPYTVKVEASSTNTDGQTDSDTATVTVSTYIEIIMSTYGATSKNYDPNDGDTISFKFTLKNNGNEPEDGITIDAKSLPEYWVIGDIEFSDTIEAGGSATITVPFKCENRDAVKEETVEMELYAISSDAITESNTVTVIINVTKPDVTISDVIGLDDISSLRGKVGSSASITVKVANDGTANADSVKVELWEDNSQETTRTISSISPGQTRQVTLKWDVPAEEVDVLIKLTGVSYESNDDNNELEFTGLDLASDIKFEGALNFSNNNPAPDDTITIKAFLSNSGGNAEDVTIIFFEGTNEIGRDTIDIDYGDTETASITWEVDASSGETLTIKAEVDIKDGPERETSLPVQEVSEGFSALGSEAGQTGLMIGVAIGAIIALIVGLLVGMMMGKRKGGAAPSPAPGGPVPTPAFRAAEKAPEEKKPEAKGPVPFEKTGAPEEEKPPTKQIARVRCPKCGKTTEVTSTQRPLQIPCSCGTTLMLKK